MGGDLHKTTGMEAPTLMLKTMKEPDSANLDQIQIIKGWIDETGIAKEKIYYVGLSDNREIDLATERPEPVGSSVNLEKASSTNTIGSAQLIAK